MRITYRTLLGLLNKMSDEQLDSDLTVEEGLSMECYQAELRIASDDHDSLDSGCPVIYYDGSSDENRQNDVEVIAEMIGLTPSEEA